MKRLLLVLSCLVCGVLHAQQEMEIIPLRHRLAEQVMPVLRPMLESGATLTGMNNQLIVRASPRNRDEIRRMLAAIDTPQRSLRVRVTQNRDAVSERGGTEIHGRIGGDSVRVIQGSGGVTGGTQIEIGRGNSGIGAQVVETRTTRTATTGQAVQVLEGSRALISVGQSLPLPMRQMVLGPNGVTVSDTTVYRDIGQGFYVEPRLVGDRVTLEISPQFDTPGGAGHGSINTQRISTTVSGRLGEWMELGGSGQQAGRNERGGFSVGTAEVRDQRSVWLLVEEIK